MFDVEGASQNSRDGKVTEKFFRWPPVCFSFVLTAIAIWLSLLDQPLLSEWMLLVSTALLGWMLAWGPGQLWQRLLMTAVLAIVPLFALGLGAIWLGADLVWFYPWTRVPVTFVSVLILGGVYAVGGRVLGFSPVWGGADRPPENRWGIAEWLVLTGLLGVSLSLLSYVVETAVVRQPAELFFAGVPAESNQRGEYWLMLLTQVVLFALIEFVLSLFVCLPVISFMVRGRLAGVSPLSRQWQLMNYTAGWCTPVFLLSLVTVNTVLAFEFVLMAFTLAYALARLMCSFPDLTWRSTRVGA